jgi:hypothetical protein
MVPNADGSTAGFGVVPQDNQTPTRKYATAQAACVRPLDSRTPCRAPRVPPAVLGKHRHAV